MDKPLRALIVEDSSDDTEILLWELRRGGYDPEYERVETAEAMRSALGKQGWDVIFADYSMPQFSGTAALEVLQETGRDIPFIFVSGTIGEDTAVEAMKNGAQDYLVKGNLGRLIPALEREMREVEERRARKKAEEGQRRGEALTRSILESALDCIISIDQEGRVVEWNPAAEKTFGYLRQAALGKAMAELIIPPSLRERHRRGLAHYLATGEGPVLNRLIELTGIRADSREFPVELFITPISVDGTLLFTAYLRDISERKRAEEALRESEQRMQHILASSPTMLYSLRVEGNKLVGTLVSENIRDILGYTVDEAMGKSWWQNNLYPEDRKQAEAESANVLERGHLVQEYRFRHKNSTYRWIRDEQRLLRDPDGKPLEVIGSWVDITEKKQAEEQIQRQLQQLTALRNIDMAITASMDLRLTLSVLLDQVTAQLGVDAAAILLLNSRTQILEYASGRGFRTSGIQQTRLRLGEGHAGRVALERKMVSIANLTIAKDQFLPTPLIQAEGFFAYYGVPLIAKGEIKGVLEVFHRSPLQPDAEWLNFLEALAGQAAIAIDNASLFDNLQRSNLELTVAYDSTIEGWSRALDLRDKETEGHTQRVTEMTLHLARAVGIKEEEMAHIRRGALLHDMGKMGIPDNILLKPGPLTDEEWVIMKKHPQHAYDMLSPIAYLRPALDIPYAHHEKWDGTGYPRGLKGEGIPLAARIFALADVWDALRSDRPYRAAWPEEKALTYIKEQAGKHFDPRVLEAFLKLVG